MDEIHPAPVQFSASQITNDPILRFFHYAHLPIGLQAASKPFCDLAALIVMTLPRNAERTVALRKLLESKDAAVRANVESMASTKSPIIHAIDEIRDTGDCDIDRDGPPAFAG